MLILLIGVTVEFSPFFLGVSEFELLLGCHGFLSSCKIGGLECDVIQLSLGKLRGKPIFFFFFLFFGKYFWCWDRNWSLRRILKPSLIHSLPLFPPTKQGLKVVYWLRERGERIMVWCHFGLWLWKLRVLCIFLMPFHGRAEKKVEREREGRRPVRWIFDFVL